MAIYVDRFHQKKFTIHIEINLYWSYKLKKKFFKLADLDVIGSNITKRTTSSPTATCVHGFGWTLHDYNI
jgi:hypothetical protein